jgi:S-adenosylmethionine:tRNA ribosyltransferase-isomerase
MRVSDFDFVLPDELVAQEALPRGQSRLLTLDRATGGIAHGAIEDLARHLRAGDVLVVNNTRVFAARLIGHRVPSGGAVECMLLGPNRESGRVDEWLALVHPGQKLKPGALMRFEGPAGALMGEILAMKFHGRRTVRLWPESGGNIEELIDRLGHMPLPPYIKRQDTADDRERYQTVYARVRGSVAAPTAGLHFSRDLVAALERTGVERVEITLHVGYGTFKPVRTEAVEEHTVDPERYCISQAAAAAVNRARNEGRRIIAVGTTTTRALESSAIAGEGIVVPRDADATVFIHPGFRFQVIDGLLTNFHLPRSSLLMLVSAFAGVEPVLAAYREAVAHRYRFYSYGDAMLIT